MKKVLMLSNVASMITQFNMPNIQILRELGFEVHVACNFIVGNTCSQDVIQSLKITLDKMNVIQHQIDFTRQTTNLVAHYRSYKQVLDIANREKFDLIFCQSTIGGAIGRIVAKKTRTRVIFIAHGLQFYKNGPWVEWAIFYPVECLLSYITDILITTNHDDFNLVNNRFGPKESVYVPGVGIEIDRFNTDNIDKNIVRKKYKIEENDKVILMAGELSTRKNHGIVIDAVKKINNPNIKLLICGLGALENDYREKIKAEGLQDNVFLLGYQKNLNELLAISDLFCFPSLNEGLPVSLMIAMAAKIPIICSDIRGNNDLIKSKDYLFCPYDIDDIIKHIKYAFSVNNENETETNYKWLSNFESSYVNKLMKQQFAKYS